MTDLKTYRGIQGTINDLNLLEMSQPADGGGFLLQFFNQTETSTTTAAMVKEISWVAFPNSVKLSSSSDREAYETADSSRSVQVDLSLTFTFIFVSL